MTKKFRVEFIEQSELANWLEKSHAEGWRIIHLQMIGTANNTFVVIQSRDYKDE